MGNCLHAFSSVSCVGWYSVTRNTYNDSYVCCCCTRAKERQRERENEKEYCYPFSKLTTMTIDGNGMATRIAYAYVHNYKCTAWISRIIGFIHALCIEKRVRQGCKMNVSQLISILCINFFIIFYILDRFVLPLLSDIHFNIKSKFVDSIENCHLFDNNRTYKNCQHERHNPYAVNSLLSGKAINSWIIDIQFIWWRVWIHFFEKFLIELLGPHVGADTSTLS